MEPTEVFLKYCKIRGILPDIKCIENYKKLNTFLLWDGRDKPLSLRSFINGVAKVYGFSSLFYDIERNWRKYPNNENYLKAKKMWSGFVRKNIFLKNVPKIGDEVKIVDPSMRDVNIIKGEFLHFDPSYQFVTIKLNNCGTTATFRARNIESVNGEPYKLDFYIKWKGKEYGNN